MGGVTRDVIRITQLTQAVLEPRPQLIIGLFKLPKRSKRVIEQRLPFVGTSLKPLPLRPVGTEGLLGGWSFPKAHYMQKTKHWNLDNMTQDTSIKYTGASKHDY